MQNWSNSGHDGGDGSNSWQSSFNFTDDASNQFDPNQAWPQSMHDATSYNATNFFETQGGEQYMSGLSNNVQGQNGYQSHGHGSMHLNQFSPTPENIDPTFQAVQTGMYSQQRKTSQIGQTHSHPQSHANFAAQSFAFASPEEQSYDPQVTQYNQSQVLHQNTHQQSHTPVQQYNSLPQHDTFTQSGQGYTRQPQHSPVQAQHSPIPQQQPQPQPQQHRQQVQPTPPPPPPQQQQQQQPVYGANSSYQSQANGHPAFSSSQQFQYQQQPQQQSFNQAQFAQQKRQSQPPQQQPAQAQSPVAQTHLQQARQQGNLTPVQNLPNLAPPAQSISPVPPPKIPQIPQTQPTEPPPKRKRVTKTTTVAVPETPTPEATVLPHEFPADKKLEDIDTFPIPVPNDEEAKALAQFSKRNKTAQARYPTIKGLPYMYFEGTTKLPSKFNYKYRQLI